MYARPSTSTPSLRWRQSTAYGSYFSEALLRGQQCQQRSLDQYYSFLTDSRKFDDISTFSADMFLNNLTLHSTLFPPPSKFLSHCCHFDKHAVQCSDCIRNQLYCKVGLNIQGICFGVLVHNNKRTIYKIKIEYNMQKNMYNNEVPHVHLH